jgi:putative spermidine/putrescine transport system permease protein
MTLANSRSGRGRAASFRPQLVGWLAAPALFIVAFAVVPALILIEASFAHQDLSGLWRPAVDFSHYANLFQPIFLRPLAISFALGAATSVLTLIVAFPVTYLIVGMRRRSQIAWLICLLTSLSLSEVLIVFSWQTLLSARVGLTRPLVWMGLLARPVSLSPSLGAVLSCLVYLVLPYVVLLLYPALSRLDREIPQAAATMGASRLRTFLTVVTPIMRGPLVTAWIGVMVTAVGAYLTPLVLAKPQQWTVGIMINRTVMEDGDVPSGAAAALFLILLMVATIVATQRLVAPREA